MDSLPSRNKDRKRREGSPVLKRKAITHKNIKTEARISEGKALSDRLTRKFQQFNKMQSFIRIKDAFLQIFGRHAAISYCQSYRFKQQWENLNRETPKAPYETSPTYAWVSLLRLLLMLVCIWSVSTSLFFHLGESLFIDVLLLAVSGVEIVKQAATLGHMSLRKRVISLVKEASFLAYGICSVVVFEKTEQGVTSLQQRIWGIYVVVNLYVKVSEIYKLIKNYHISSQYRDIVNLFDLFMLLLCITHIVALIICWTAEWSPLDNWMTRIGVGGAAWADQYVYSLYFSSTTLLTVGYGDIAPTNIYEIMAILVTQFIGIATFGYTVNQIGAVLSGLQEKSERLQKDLGSVENLGKSYKLESDVIAQMRTEIINSKRIDEDLAVSEENQLLAKFTEDLREKIKFESNIKVLKRSLFIIVSWTGKLQSKLATRLVKQIFKAEEVLLQAPGREKLYILDKGKIDILTNVKQNYKSCFPKIVKTITADDKADVMTQNVYGYSSIVSDRCINLNAMAKQVTVCYTLGKNDFMELIIDSEEDMQFFHQLKDQVQHAVIPEQIEVPAITNIREHYRPSALFVIAKSKQKYLQANARKRRDRRTNRVKLRIFHDLNQCSIKPDLAQLHSALDAGQSQLEVPRPSIDIHSMKLLQAIVALPLHKPSAKNIPHFDEFENEFEAMKSFQRYFGKFNVENVLSRLSSRNFGRRRRAQNLDQPSQQSDQN